MLFGDAHNGGGVDVFGFLHSAALYITFLIVVVYHMAHLCYDFFGWPQWLVKMFESKEQRSIRHVLQEIGFDENWQETVRAADLRKRVAAVGRYSNARDRCIGLLKRFTRKGNVDVGAVTAQVFPYYVDLMSGSLDMDVASECAIILASYLRYDYKGREIACDGIVGIKEGSPSIACQFGKSIEKPVSLYRGSNDYKFNRSQADRHLLFDGNVQQGMKMLIVDDSTTGGRKVAECVAALRSVGCEVSDCLVLFEPLGKGARDLLRENGVELHAVVKMDVETQKEIGL